MFQKFLKYFWKEKIIIYSETSVEKYPIEIYHLSKYVSEIMIFIYNFIYILQNKHCFSYLDRKLSRISIEIVNVILYFLVSEMGQLESIKNQTSPIADQ